MEQVGPIRRQLPAYLVPRRRRRRRRRRARARAQSGAINNALGGNNATEKNTVGGGKGKEGSMGATRVEKVPRTC